MNAINYILEHKEFISWKSNIGKPAAPRPQDQHAKSPAEN